MTRKNYETKEQLRVNKCRLAYEITAQNREIARLKKEIERLRNEKYTPIMVSIGEGMGVIRG